MKGSRYKALCCEHDRLRPFKEKASVKDSLTRLEEQIKLEEAQIRKKKGEAGNGLTNPFKK